MTYNRISLIATIAAVVLSLPFFGRNWNIFMHQLGAVLFLGNIIVSAAWMGLARHSGNPEALRLGVHGVIVTDAVFISPGALLLGLNGGILASPYFRARATWLLVGIALFIATAIIWRVALVPIQRKLARAMDQMPVGGPIPPECKPLLARWFRLGGIASLLPLIVLVLMVLKPAF